MDYHYSKYKNEDGSTIFRYHFPSLVDFVEYLRTAPTNRETFYTLYSEEVDKPGKHFRGEPFQDTLDHLIYGYNKQYEEFCEKCNMDSIEIDQLIDYSRVRPKRGFAGSRVDINAYVNGLDKCMLRPTRTAPRKFININYDLSYRASAKESAIVNRGMSCLLLINALEQNNYSVDLNSFVLLQQVINDETKEREIVYGTINLKDINSTLNEAKCIGPFMRIEFIRRCVHRLVETTPVHPSWQISHGYVIKSTDEIKKIIGAGEGDLLFEEPEKMQIEGEDLTDDFEAVIRHLNLEDVVRLRKRLK